MTPEQKHNHQHERIAGLAEAAREAAGGYNRQKAARAGRGLVMALEGHLALMHKWKCEGDHTHSTSELHGVHEEAHKVLAVENKISPS